ncbi:hypothetical protein MJG53_017030 [Ovis ammon polii x Ovis aries]|uniref:Uncharacterized protein n=1 Tax=Ovis ammon polii x Ovis aries TaxID=2918886 RepID=A0ACB9UAW1_9CETA|nr:hypothetical protein MJG53_017030 [Ovis ammon polii x Ovis aries]
MTILPSSQRAFYVVYSQFVGGGPVLLNMASPIHCGFEGSPPDFVTIITACWRMVTRLWADAEDVGPGTGWLGLFRDLHLREAEVMQVHGPDLRHNHILPMRTDPASESPAERGVLWGNMPSTAGTTEEAGLVTTPEDETGAQSTPASIRHRAVGLAELVFVHRMAVVRPGKAMKTGRGMRQGTRPGVRLLFGERMPQRQTQKRIISGVRTAKDPALGSNREVDTDVQNWVSIVPVVRTPDLSALICFNLPMSPDESSSGGNRDLPVHSVPSCYRYCGKESDVTQVMERATQVLGATDGPGAEEALDERLLLSLNFIWESDLLQSSSGRKSEGRIVDCEALPWFPGGGGGSKAAVDRSSFAKCKALHVE